MLIIPHGRNMLSDTQKELLIYWQLTGDWVLEFTLSIGGQPVETGITRDDSTHYTNTKQQWRGQTQTALWYLRVVTTRNCHCNIRKTFVSFKAFVALTTSCNFSETNPNCEASYNERYKDWKDGTWKTVVAHKSCHMKRIEYQVEVFPSSYQPFGLYGL